MQKLLTPKEVAGLIGVTESTLGLWRCKKRYNLPYVKIGWRVMYKPEEVQTFINSRSEGEQNVYV